MRFKVRAVRAWNGRIQCWTVNYGNRELWATRDHVDAMNIAKLYATGKLPLAA